MEPTKHELSTETQSCKGGVIGPSLHPDNEILLAKVTEILREKMIRNEQKYGWTNDWLLHDWEDECREEMRRHLEKGDPRDVAIYAFFMIFRGWSTVAPDGR